MLIIRPTNSLAQKMKVKVQSHIAPTTALLGDWYGIEVNISTHRLALFVSSTTRLGIVVKAAPYADTTIRLKGEIQRALTEIGIDQNKISAELSHFTSIAFAKTESRSLIGTLNDLRNNLIWYVDAGRAHPSDVAALSQSLFEIPMRTLDWKYPIEAVRKAFEPSSHINVVPNEPAEPVFMYESRRGSVFYAHKGTTYTGKPRFFMSKQREGALVAVPENLEVFESLNGVVGLRNKVISLVTDEDFLLLKKLTQKLKNLKGHKVERKKDHLLIFRPDSADFASLNGHTPAEMFSPLLEFEDYARRHNKPIEDVLGMSLAKARKIMKSEAQWRFQKMVAMQAETARYSPVMKFTLDRSVDGDHRYVVERREYRGRDKRWLILDEGSLADLAPKYLCHIDKDSFFELDLF
jgi:hypothetical protein